MKTNKPKSANHKAKHSHTSRRAKVFDVAAPGKTAPSSSARPLIVTDRPMIKDPMVSLDESSAPAPVAANVPAKPAVRRIGINLQPPTQLLPAHFDDEPTPVVESEPYDPLSDGPPPQSLRTRSALSPAASPPMPSIASEPPKPSPVAAPPQTSSPVQPAPHHETVPTKQEQEPLIDIVARNRASSMRLAVVGAILIIVVAIGCVDAMLDAGALQINGVPHTHFFKQ